MSEGDGEAAAREGKADSAPRALVILDPDESARQQSEALSSALDLPVVFMNLDTTDAECMGQIANAAAVLVPWDLGHQAGLDLVEALRLDPRTCEVPILMASCQPSEAMVRAALAAGAASFAMQPYDADELQRRLGALQPRTES